MQEQSDKTNATKIDEESDFCNNKNILLKKIQTGLDDSSSFLPSKQNL